MQRNRAERLLRDLQAVDLRVTRSSDVERVFGTRATKSAKCDTASCDYAMRFASPLEWGRLVRVLEFAHLPVQAVLHILLRLGARPALINAEIKVRNGIAWGKGIAVAVITPGRNDQPGPPWPDYELIGRVWSVSRFHHHSSNTVPAELQRHPDYMIGKPGGCDGPCVEGHVLFTPYIPSEDLRRLMHFDLTCLTRWRSPCRTQADIMPFAWAEYEQEHKLPDLTANRTSKFRLVEILGRDATAIAVLRIFRIDRYKEPSEYVIQDGHAQATGKTYVSQRATAHVLQVLKGNQWHEGENTTLLARQYELPFHENQRLLVLLDPIWTEAKESTFYVSPRQALPPTSENLARVRSGISEDFEYSK